MKAKFLGHNNYLISTDIEFPEERKLKAVEKVPRPLNFKHEKMSKKLIYMRGPEEVHTFLLHKQFGIKVRSCFCS